MTEGTKYLITNGFDIFRFADSKEEAAELAADEAYSDGEIGIFEIKQIGYAYVPEPSAQIGWYN